jgi:hypothetical protein
VAQLLKTPPPASLEDPNVEPENDLVLSQFTITKEKGREASQSISQEHHDLHFPVGHFKETSFVIGNVNRWTEVFRTDMTRIERGETNKKSWKTVKESLEPRYDLTEALRKQPITIRGCKRKGIDELSPELRKHVGRKLRQFLEEMLKEREEEERKKKKEQKEEEEGEERKKKEQQEEEEERKKKEQEEEERKVSKADASPTSPILTSFPRTLMIALEARLCLWPLIFQATILNMKVCGKTLKISSACQLNGPWNHRKYRSTCPRDKITWSPRAISDLPFKIFIFSTLGLGSVFSLHP